MVDDAQQADVMCTKIPLSLWRVVVSVVVVVVVGVFVVGAISCTYIIPSPKHVHSI